MNDLFYSPQAMDDLDDIWRYIREELGNARSARKIVNGIMDSAERLREFSELGPRLSSITRVESEYRFLVCGEYIVFYRKEDKGVFVDRVLYGRRDYLRILFDLDVTEE